MTGRGLGSLSVVIHVTI